MSDSIGKRIGLLRRQSRLTQEDLARAVGVPRSCVAHWETDRSGAGPHLEAVARTFGVAAEALLNGGASRMTTETFTADETELLASYRRCSAADRVAVLRTAAKLATNGAPGEGGR